MLNCTIISIYINYQDNLPPAVVVVGDHGMAEGGGHGGASEQELLVPLVIMSPFLEVGSCENNILN